MERKIKKNKKTNRCAPRVREQKKGIAARPCVCQREDRSHIPAKRREMVSGKREKTRRKKKRTKRKRRHIPECRQGGGGIQERGEGEDVPRSVSRKGWGGVVSQNKGETGKGNLGGVGHDLEFPRVTKSTVGTFPNSATFATSHTVLTPLHFCPPACALFLSTGTWAPLAGKPRGGLSPFFMTSRPFRSNAWRCCKRLVHLFFFLSFSTADPPSSRVAFATRRPRLILSPPHRHVSPSPRRHRRVAPLPRVPLSRRPLPRVTLIASPLATRHLSHCIPFCGGNGGEVVSGWVEGMRVRGVGGNMSAGSRGECERGE